MEIEENNRSSKRSRVANGRQAAAKLGDEDEDDGEAKTVTNSNNCCSIVRPWHNPSSRIFRVSRASGGKDRHSKVYTSKGLRDRRVRLSVSTAIQFYDLQDRLGYDQPSKAIEWLIKAATSAIAELPSLDANFTEPMGIHHHVEKLMPNDSGMDPEAEPSYNQQQQQSSTSETSKGSVLSLSRSEIREKARVRAKERVRDKEKDHVDQSLNSQGSFTKLLTGGGSSPASAAGATGQASSGANFAQKQMQNLPSVTSTAEYFSTQSSFFGSQQQSKVPHQTGFSSQGHFGNTSPIGMVPLISIAGDQPGPEMQQFAFLQEHFYPVAAAAAANGGDYNLNFSISPNFAGFHRGTLQSNSPSHHHHHHQLSHHQVQPQRLSSAIEGPSVPFFFSTAATSAATNSPTENPYPSGFDGHLQLCDGYKHFELKGEGKS